ncbi:MAG: hypothetical protein J0L73_14695 [Verrucomicrobia bacterium]|nr:hypothetical protein [Verrucomicrobiota bacterium]
MKLQTLLRRCVRIVLPFVHWRVPVTLLRGRARASGGEVVLLSVGPRSAFIIGRFFAQEPAEVRRTRVPVWRLQRLVEEWRAEADLVDIEIDRVSAGLFLNTTCYLAVPRWITSWMNVPEDLREFGRTHRNARTDLRRIRTKQFECHLSREKKDFDLFCEKFHRPHISARHGDLTMVSPRWMMRYVFRQGMIQWVSRKGEKLAGGILTIKGKELTKRVNGVLDGRADLLKEGALSALYVHAMQEARRLGCTELNMGGSMPSLHDGVFRYKSKWSSGLRSHEGFLSANCVTLIGWNRLAGPVAEFLSQTSLIHHDQDGYSALWVFPHDQPLTAEILQQEYDKLDTAGLRRFDILLPGEAPAGFVCPANVSLIPLTAVREGGPEQLKCCELAASELTRETIFPDVNSSRQSLSRS